MPIKMKVHGNQVIAFFTRDDFKESDHPRSKTGEFAKTAGGGSTAKIKNGVSKPKAGSTQEATWSWVEHFHEKHGSYPTSSQAKAKAIQEGWSEHYTPKSVNLFKKFHADGKESEEEESEWVAEPESQKPEPAPEPKPEPEPEPTANTKENFKKFAEELGYAHEGNYNGIEYYKSGTQKLSYSEAGETWVYKENGETKFVGTELDVMKLEVPLSESPTDEPVAIPSSPSSFASSSSKTSTHTAPVYGKAMPAEKFTFSSKGIPDEKGLPSGVQESIQRYKGSYYQDINNAMRYSTDFHSVSQQTMIDILNIQRAFQMAPPTTKDVEVGRKFKIEALKGMAKDAGIDDLEHIVPGTILQEQAICSTSHNEGTWHGDVVMRITIPKGSKAIDLSETINKGEAETILPPGTKFKINSIKKMNSYGDKWHIVCEVM